jgi:hypothetical protein
VGLGHARKIMFLEWDAIETTISTKGYMGTGGELQGEKWVGIKPFLLAPSITYFHKVVAQGNM